jgi:PAS domain S-box-containing protein
MINNCVSTAITAAMIQLVAERDGEVEALLASADEPAELLTHPGRYVPNETFIILTAQARQLTADPGFADALGELVADNLLTAELRRALALTPEAEAVANLIRRALTSLWLNLEFTVTATGPDGLQIEAARKGEVLFTHDHCLFLRGLLRRLVAIAGGREVGIEESRCLVPVDRVGELPSGGYRIDDSGRIWRLEGKGELQAGIEEEIGEVAPDLSHEIEGVVYAAGCCRYLLRWQNPRPWPQRLWDHSAGRAGQFVQTLINLETGRLDTPRDYARVVEKWKHWLHWEPSWALTRLKYFSYLIIAAVAALDWVVSLSGARFLQSQLAAASALIIALMAGAGLAVVRLLLAHSRNLIRRREDTEKFLHTADVAVTTILPDYTIEYANPLTLDRHGDVIGRKCYEVFKWETAPCLDCPLAEAFSPGRPVSTELRYYNRDGADTWLHVTATPILDDAGSVTSVITVAADVTDRKRLEIALDRKHLELESSEARYRNFMAGAADAIIITGPDHELLEANKEALALLALDSLDPYVGKSLFQANFVAVDDRLRLRELFTEMIAEREPRRFETRLIGRGGAAVEIEARAIPILEGDTVACVQSILRDVTARKHEEFEQRLLLAMANAIKDATDLDSMVGNSLRNLCTLMYAPVGAIFLRRPDKPQLVIAATVGASHAAIQKLAAAAADGLATDVASRAAILKQPLVIGDIAKLRLTPEDRQTFKTTAVASVASVPMLVGDQLEGLIYLAATDRDYFSPKRLAVLNQVAAELATGIGRQRLTDLVLAQNSELTRKNQELQNATVQLFQSDKMASVGQLAAGVAHEINNPMGYINSNLNLLNEYRGEIVQVLGAYEALAAAADGRHDPQLLPLLEAIARIKSRINLPQLILDLKDMIDESIEGAERVTHIVKSLRDFSHPESSDARMASLNDCIDSTLKIVWNELKYKADVVKDYGDLSPIECYPQELKQVFMNLLVNASQAIPERGEIRIRTYAEPPWAVIEIHDTGVGIKPEDIPKVFDPFFTTKEVGKGTGLGLAISYSIINKHHGVLEVDSVPGKGSTFRVKLPLPAPIPSQSRDILDSETPIQPSASL